jgi:hypothetical protein
MIKIFRDLRRFWRFSYIKDQCYDSIFTKLAVHSYWGPKTPIFCRQKIGENILKIVTAWAKLFQGKR